MQGDWLSASSFERVHDIISAINTLSIHAKLMLRGVPDPVDEAEVVRSRTYLFEFLNRFQHVLSSAEQSSDGTVVGVDPRLGELAVRYLSQKQRRYGESRLFTVPVDQLREVAESVLPENLHTLVAYLDDLRTLLEQNSRADVVGVLGEM